MGKLNVQICPETGVCSIARADGVKVDLVPQEVADLKKASARPEALRQLLAEVDEAFAEKLAPDELAQLAQALR